MKIKVTAAFLLKAATIMTVFPGTHAELQTEDVANNGTMSLMEREEEPEVHGRGRAICGIYANGFYPKFKDLVFKLDNDLKGNDYKIDGGQCDRVQCYDTTALWVCNDNPDAITLKGKDISIALRYIRLHCCHTGPRMDDAISGQQFTPWGWTANAGYGNCNDPPNIRPHMAGGWGVNPGNCPYMDWPSQPF